MTHAERKKCCESVNKTLGKRLTYRMIEKGYTIENLAFSTYVSVMPISEAKLGKKGLSLVNLIAVAQELDCSTDYLLGLSEVPQSTKSADFIENIPDELLIQEVSRRLRTGKERFGVQHR